MTDIRKPRRGSMAFRPRKRTRRTVPTVFWPSSDEKKLLGFAGYKAGMVQVAYVDDTTSPSRGKEVVTAATVVEVPPITVYAIRGHKNNQIIGEMLTTDDKILKLLKIKNLNNKTFKAEDCDNVSVLVFTNPSKTNIGKKHIERMETYLGGSDSSDKLGYAKSILGKEFSVKDIFKPGEYIDVVAVTKGKGWQGPTKRFGTSLQRRKATGKRRHIGCLGAFSPGYVMYTAPQSGQMGYFKRTEYNKRIFKIGENGEEINPSSGFPHYGFVKNNYILLKGSIPGPVKRMIRMRVAMRKRGDVNEPAIKGVLN